MRDEQCTVAAAALVIGAILGMAGSFAPTAELRGLFWGVDGTALVVGCALLVIHHLRHGDATLAAGFLVFLVGETLIVSASSMGLTASAPTLAGGAALWAAALALNSTSAFMPRPVRVIGVIASVLLAITAARLFSGASLTPLSRPLPFFAFPFLAASLVGWAWAHTRSVAGPSANEEALPVLLGVVPSASEGPQSSR